MSPFFSSGHMTMADITEISDDEEGPTRKPIGWNYQNVNNADLMEGKIINNRSTVIAANNEVTNNRSLKRIPSSDDIEVLEIVDIKRSSKPKPLLPESSSRKEIKNLTRNIVQSDITSFLSVDKRNLKARHSKLSLSKLSRVRKDKLVNGETLIPQVNLTSYKTCSASNVHSENESNAQLETLKPSIIKGDKIHEDNFVNGSQPKCPLVQINLSDEKVKERETSLLEPEVSLSIYKVTADNQSIAGASQKKENESPGISEAPEKTDEEITSEYSKSLFEKFIERWKSFPGYGGDDFKINDKLWKRYYTSHTTYTHSRKFANGMKKATDIINKENRYVIIKDIQDTLKNYKDSPYIEKKKLTLSKDDETAEKVKSDADKKREKKLKKLERLMAKTHKKIQAMDMEEVDLDDEDNSSYLLQERLKTFFMKLDDMYCKIANYSTATGRPVEKKFKYEGSRYPEINLRITAWVNKHRDFPDYTDILRLVKEVTKTSSLPLRPETVRVQAQEIFRDVGRILKDRRQRDDIFSIYAYAGDDLNVDPADTDPDLYQKLASNEKEAKVKLDNVFHHFVEKEIEEREKIVKKKEQIKPKENDDIIEDKEKDSEIAKDTEINSDICIRKDEENDPSQYNVSKVEKNIEANEVISESDSIVEEESEDKESVSESDQYDVDTAVSNGRLSNPNNETDLDSNSTTAEQNAATELSEANRSIQSNLLDISDTSEDEEIIHAMKDTLIPKMELESIQDEMANNSTEYDFNDATDEYSEEDILIADSPVENKEDSEDSTSLATKGTNVTHFKRRLNLPSKPPKRRQLEPPEIVELD